MTTKHKIISGIIVLVLIGGFIGYYGVWTWVVCRVYCEEGESLKITRKTGAAAPTDAYASSDANQQGVREQMKGPGRHFLNPWTYGVEHVNNIKVKAGEVVVIKNNLGKDLPAGRFIADPDEKGTQRKVLTPGIWRINPYGQTIAKTEKCTLIKPGYVGVQTLREGDAKGIQDVVLTPGLHPINTRLVRPDMVEVGYRVWTVQTQYTQDTITTENKVKKTIERPKEGTGISFPLADGNEMFLDITVIWGIYPKEAPRIIRDYGTVDMVLEKIIEPQVTSICKNLGSNYTTMQFIRSESREEFQDLFTESLISMGEQKGIHILTALVRRFHPDPEIKSTIQATLLAEEEKLTLAIEKDRDKVAANLEQAVRKVDIAQTDFDAETQKLVSAEKQEGIKKAAEIKEDANRNVASLEKETAEIDAKAVVIAGQAEADVIKAMKVAEAKGLKLQVDAYGNADIFNLSTFADMLNENMKITYKYSGDGTLWTDPETNLQQTASKKILEGK